MKLSQLRHFEWALDRTDVKVLRHRDTTYDLWDLRRRGTFGAYRDGQGWDVFGRARFVIAFIAERYRYAKFVGVWEVTSKTVKAGRGVRYKTVERKDEAYDDLEGRLVIEWGGGTRSWAQWFHGAGDKKIVELLPPNYVGDFPGYYNFTLSHDELVAMTRNPDSNREWCRMLSSVSGVYVILDRATGMQYIGSAYGRGGVWARWSAYARTGSGGNVLLEDLLRRSADAHRQFQFSLLRVLEAAATRDEVIAHERLLKRKLGSRAFGLNGN